MVIDAFITAHVQLISCVLASALSTNVRLKEMNDHTLHDHHLIITTFSLVVYEPADALVHRCVFWLVVLCVSYAIFGNATAFLAGHLQHTQHALQEEHTSAEHPYTQTQTLNQSYYCIIGLARCMPCIICKYSNHNV